MDWLTFYLALGSGIANGTFPVFIKTRAVLAADVHPVVFQLYKSSWVAIAGLFCALVRLARGLSLDFTPWALASSAAWIPSGVCTIIAVPLIGVGSAVLLTSATGAALSFLVFWLGFHEQVRLHQVGSHEIVIAPYYLLGCLIGMAGLVGAQQASTRADLPPPLSDAFASDSVHPLAGSDSASEEAGTDEVTAAAKRPNGSVVRRTILGGAAAVTSGVFSALQYGLVQLGRRETVGERECSGSNPPWALCGIPRAKLGMPRASAPAWIPAHGTCAPTAS